MKIGSFTIVTTPDKIVISNGTSGVSLAPAEVSKAAAIVSAAMKLSSFKALPAQIKQSPFEVRFAEGKDKSGNLKLSCVLGRQGDKTEGCIFEFSDGDNLVKALEASLTLLKDQLTVGSGPSRRLARVTSPEPPITGR